MVSGIYSGRRKEVAPKYFPVNDDLKNLLREMGYEQKMNAEEYIIDANGNVTEKTLMDRLSEAFTHCKEEAGITKRLSLAE